MAGQRWPLHSVAGTRQIETALASGLPSHALMQRAGLASAKLALAVAPHARTIWIACGPGNNGGDGLEAAAHLQSWGKQVLVTLLDAGQRQPVDAALARERARSAGVRVDARVPEQWDLCIDALLGIGAARPVQGEMADSIARINAGATPVLAIDVPSGLDADTGRAVGACVQAGHTLSLLTLKPGLFTGQARDHTGQIWFNDLQSGAGMPDAASTVPTLPPKAWLLGPLGWPQRAQASHKGDFGDVAIVGGAPGMGGAAVLAGSAALHAGAGRVFIGGLGSTAAAYDPNLPELMWRPLESLDLAGMTTVCGCGGGDLVRHHLGRVLSTTPRLVLDADGLNAIAGDLLLQTLLLHRAQRGWVSVLTPHPLEAARLLGSSSTQVQQDRLAAAQDLANRFVCTVLLKGSGSIIASPGCTPAINPSGNSRLSSAGTGDVLAGLLGAALAAGMEPFDAACTAAWRHGHSADQWPVGPGLTAAALARSL